MKRSLCVLLVLGTSLPLSADWLVTRDGARIETLERWEVRHGTVVFKTPQGTLSSMRLADVDLVASEAATLKAKEPPAPPPPVVRAAPVLVLTTKDVGIGQLVEPDAETGESSGVGGTAAEPPVPTTDVPVEVISWEKEDLIDLNGYRLIGRLRNNGGDPVQDVNLTITLFGADLQEVGRTVAQLDATFLRADDSTSFRAVFQDVTEFQGEPRFHITAKPPPTIENLRIGVIDGRDAAELFRGDGARGGFERDDLDGFGDLGDEPSPDDEIDFEERPAGDGGDGP